MTYVFDVSEDAACAQSQSTFYAFEQIVMSQALGHDRQQTFVTHFQGTFRLKKGNLQLRGLGFHAPKPPSSQATQHHKKLIVTEHKQHPQKH